MSATNRGAERNPRDEYQTPLWAVHAIMQYIEWDSVHTFLEPCRGDGHVWYSLPRGLKRTWRELNDGRDYLTWTPKTEFDLILTNPPYSLAIEFLQKSLVEGLSVAYLLRVNFLGAIERAGFWEKNPPTNLFPLYPRPSFTGDGTDMTEYAWFVWDRIGVLKEGTPHVLPITHPDANTRKKPLPSEHFLPRSLASLAPRKRRVRG